MRDTERRHVVRLAIQRSEHGPSVGGRERVEQVLRGGLERFIHTVDDLGDGVQFFLTPAEYQAFLAALDHVWDDTDGQRAS